MHVSWRSPTFPGFEARLGGSLVSGPGPGRGHASPVIASRRHAIRGHAPGIGRDGSAAVRRFRVAPQLVERPGNVRIRVRPGPVGHLLAGGTTVFAKSGQAFLASLRLRAGAALRPKEASRAVFRMSCGPGDAHTRVNRDERGWFAVHGSRRQGVIPGAAVHEAGMPRGRHPRHPRERTAGREKTACASGCVSSRVRERKRLQHLGATPFVESPIAKKVLTCRYIQR